MNVITAVWAWMIVLFTTTWHVTLVIAASPAFWVASAAALAIAAAVLTHRGSTR